MGSDDEKKMELKEAPVKVWGEKLSKVEILEEIEIINAALAAMGRPMPHRIKTLEKQTNPALVLICSDLREALRAEMKIFKNSNKDKTVFEDGTD
jgi:hypothetical protein